MDGNSGPSDPIGVRRILVLVVGVCLVGGCQTAAGPEYDRPAMNVSTAEWSQLEGRELRPSDIIQREWWTEFHDDYLDSLIDEALDESSDLKMLALRLDTAGINAGEAQRDRLPDLRTDVSRTNSNSSTSGSSFDESVNVKLSWEIDVWGKIKKQAQASNATYLATEMDWRAAYLTLVTNIAERYFGIRQYDEQITQQKIALDQAQDLEKIYNAQYNEGIVPKTTVLNQEARVSTLNQSLMEIERNRTESELRLATLIGRQSGRLHVPPAPLLDTVDLLEVPHVLPADMLARRPDVLGAEYRLLAAHHLLGRARLARLPSFNLNATTSLLTGAWSLSFVENFSNMFDRDLRVEADISENARDELVEGYRKAVLNAFEEVEVALLNIRVRKQQMAELNKQIAALQVVNNVQLQRLREGLVSQLEVFQTESALLNAQQSILSTYQQMLTDTLNLYKALGGGWPPEEVQEDSMAARNTGD